MEDKVFCAKVERLNRLQTVLILWTATFAAFGMSELVNKWWGIRIPGEAILIGILVLACILLVKIESYFPTTEEIVATFEKEGVTFKKGKRIRKIAYTQIKEVQKMMIINRFHSEKGYYRVKIKTKGSAYALYTGEDSSRQLDFEKTELSGIYFELKKRGVKCC